MMLNIQISNSIGSNLFDILVCLGLPWFLESIVIRPGQLVQVYSGGIIYSSMLLFSSVFLLLICFVVNKWRLTKKFGIVMIVFWVLITVIACLFELDIFGKFSIPVCE
jgi:Ca2+/Na+ antiporter